MWKTYKTDIVLAIVLIGLPMVFGFLMWNRLPESMAIHFSVSGAANSYAGKLAALLLPALFILLVFLAALAFVFHDPRQQNQNPKALRAVFWTIPLVNAAVYFSMYGYALHWDFPVTGWFILAMGLLFIILGNIMPKIEPNETFGIRLPWTLASRENWVKTHRFGGKVWVTGGLILLFCIWLPEEAAMWVFFAVLLLICLIPGIYSYVLYRKQKATGERLTLPRFSKITLAVVLAALVLAGILLFTGSVWADVNADEKTVELSCTWWNDISIPVDEIESMDVVPAVSAGSRTNGLGSPRVNAGTFENDTYGSYQLYSPTDATYQLVIHTQDETYVFGTESPSEADDLMQEIHQLKINS